MGELRPMLAELAPEPFDSEKWLFEPKWDGARCLAYVTGDGLRIVGRSGNDYSFRFPEINRDEVKTSADLVLDGELICGDGSSRSFHLIQRRIHKQDSLQINWASKENPATLMVFDVLEVDGISTLTEPLWQRKLLLDKHLKDSSRVMHTPFVEGEGRLLFESLAGKGYEGVMAKHRDSHYLLGKRTESWLKVKVVRQDTFLAVGMTPGKGARSDTFGALILASVEDGGLAHKGEVGSGFSNGDLKHVIAIAEDSNPHLRGINGVRWIKPIKVRVKFLEETEDGKLRFPVFLRLEGIDLFSLERGLKINECEGGE